MSLHACSQERFGEVKAALHPFLLQCGFRDAGLQWLPASAPQGENLSHAPTNPLLSAWWHGPTLVAAIDQLPAATSSLDKPLRMPVTEVSKASRGGVAVSGRLAAGALKARLHASCCLLRPSFACCDCRLAHMH